VRPPRSALALDPDAVRRSFACTLTCVLANGERRRQDAYLIPTHTIPGTSIVLGTSFLRAPLGEARKYAFEPDPEELFSDPQTGFDTMLSNFVYDLKSGRFYQLGFGAMYYTFFSVMKMTPRGTTSVESGIFNSAGDLVTQVRAKRECEFCVQRRLECTCSESMRQRTFGEHVALSSWAQFLEQAQGSYQTEVSFKLLHIKGHALPDSHPTRQLMTCSFGDNKYLMELRAAYLHHLTTITRKVPLWGSTALPDKRPLSSVLPGEMLENLDIFSVTTDDLWAETDALLGSDLLEGISLEGSYETTTQSGSGRKCPHCGKQFLKTNHLNRHIAAAHEGKRPFECDLCDLAFTQLGNLRRHKQSVHEGKRNFVCEICKGSFASLSNLKRHTAKQHSAVPRV